MPYPVPPAGLPEQSQLINDRARFTSAYAVVPRGVLRDIVTSRLPGWHGTRAWILARPLSGFAETFFQAILEISAGGYSEEPEPEPDAEGAFFVLDGELEIRLQDRTERLAQGGFAWIKPGERYEVANPGATPVTFHWIRKAYHWTRENPPPQSFSIDSESVASDPMEHSEGRWRTKRLLDPEDMGHDMHVNIVEFEPGGMIPFAETHVMEHGIYILEGKGVYHLNNDWVEVQAGDFLWLRAFCPQACYAGGAGPFRYLLYKDVNRHSQLRL